MEEESENKPEKKVIKKNKKKAALNQEDAEKMTKDVCISWIDFSSSNVYVFKIDFRS